MKTTSAKRRIKRSCGEKKEFFDCAPIGFFILDNQGLVIDVNIAGTDKLGRTKGYIINKSFSSFIDKNDKKEFSLYLKQVQVSLKPMSCEISINSKDKSILNVRLESISVRDSAGRCTQIRMGMIDLTEHKGSAEVLLKNAEDHHFQEQSKLKETKARYRKLYQEFTTLLDAIPDNLILLNPELKIQWANRAFSRKIKRKVSDLLGKHCYQMCCSITVPCKNCPVQKSLVSGKEESTRVMGIDGRIFDKRAFPVRNEEDVLVNVIEVSRDITAQVHMEEEAKLVQARLIHTNKMTSLGTLVAGVAHEINNPNSFILNNAQIFADLWGDAVKILSKYFESNTDLRLAGMPFREIKKTAPQLLSGVISGSLRIKNIVENLKGFSRPDRLRMDGEVNVNTIIMTASSILDNRIRKTTRNYHVMCSDVIPPVRGSSQQIEQVIINLILNALQALPDKRAGIWVSSAVNKKKSCLEIKVKDEGCGIPPEIIGKVTEPFFTTKVNIGGTGLGLSISNTIIIDHGGSLSIKSKEGEGTAVTITLPIPV